MPATLLDTARRYAEAHSNRPGAAPTPIPGLTVIRETKPSPLQYAISRPLVALVLQGSKRVTVNRQNLQLNAGDSLLISADVPTVSQITRADLKSPYLSIIIELDPAVIEGLIVELDAVPDANYPPARVDPTERELENVALRLLDLLDRPASLGVLQSALLRELHYWLLAGQHGTAIRGLGITENHARRVARAVSIIRCAYAQPLRVDQLAEVAGMSQSSFHEHFRAITSLTPLQFQKQLRLIEARRMLLADGAMISHAAYAVGYQSIPQFTREYGRMFGLPPARDLKAIKDRVQAA